MGFIREIYSKIEKSFNKISLPNQQEQSAIFKEFKEKIKTLDCMRSVYKTLILGYMLNWNPRLRDA